MSPLRRQLTVYSPLTAGSLLRALTATLHSADALLQLHALLTREYAAESVVLCGSGTQALQLAITAAARPFGAHAPIAIPAFTCYDVGSAAVGVSAPLHLFDIDPQTLTPDLDSVRQVLQAGAKVVVVCPLYGLPVDWEALENLSAEYGAVLVENAAQGHGASWRGRRLGTLGSISVLSFGRGKGWTGGHGGAVLLRSTIETDEQRFTWLESVPVFLPLAAQWLLGRPFLYELPASLPWLHLGQTTYRDPQPVRELSTAAAAVLLHTHARAAREAVVRKNMGRRFLAELRDVRGVTAPKVIPDGDPGYIRFPLRISPRARTADFGRAAARVGIAPSYPSGLAALRAVRQLLVGSPHRRWRGATTLVDELVTLPTHSRVTEADCQRILDLIRRSAASGISPS